MKEVDFQKRLEAELKVAVEKDEKRTHWREISAKRVLKSTREQLQRAKGTIERLEGEKNELIGRLEEYKGNTTKRGLPGAVQFNSH